LLSGRRAPLFAFPAAAVFLTARAISFPARDLREKATRQQLFVGAVFAMVICAIVLSVLLLPATTATN
jgi:hypothetical protein